MSAPFQPKAYWESKILSWERFRYSPWLLLYPPSWPLRIRLVAAQRLIQRRLQAGESILELGCGSGVLARRLEGRGYLYRGMDWASNAIELAKAKNHDRNFRFEVGDAARAEHPEARVTVFLGLTDWLSAADLERLFSRLRSPDLLFSFTESKNVALSPYKLYRRWIDGGRGKREYRARSYDEDAIHALLDRAGYAPETWRRASFFNPGVLVWATKKK